MMRAVLIIRMLLECFFGMLLFFAIINSIPRTLELNSTIPFSIGAFSVFIIAAALTWFFIWDAVRILRRLRDPGPANRFAKPRTR